MNVEIPHYLFHGSGADFDDIIENGLIAQVGAWTKSVLGTLHDHDSPAVWLTDKIGMAGHYAVNNYNRLSRGGTIFVIDTDYLAHEKFVFVDEDYKYPIDDDGDEDRATHYAYADNIPPEAIVDSIYVEDYTIAMDKFGPRYGGIPEEEF